MVVLPSPGLALVTTSARPPSPAEVKIRFVRSTRYASATGELGLRVATASAAPRGGVAPPGIFVSTSGTMPRKGSCRCSFTSSGVLKVLSRCSNPTAMPTPSASPMQQRKLVVAHPPGAHRCARRLGLLHDPDVRRLQLRLEPRLLRLRQQVLVELLVRVHVALEHAELDRLAAGVLGLLLHRLEARGQARLLGEGRTVLALGGARDVADLGADLVLRLPDLRAHADHVGVPLAERLREPRLLLLQRGQLDLERLHRLAADDEREVLGLPGAGGSDLVVERLLRDALGARVEHGALERLQLLLDEALALLLVHEPLALAVLLKRLLRGLDLGLLLLQPIGQPAGGLGRRRETQLERLLDVELREGVHGVGRDAWVVRAEAKVHQARARDRLDHHPRPERRDGRRKGDPIRVEGRRRRVAEEPLHPLERAHHRPRRELAALLQLQPLDDTLRRGPGSLIAGTGSGSSRSRPAPSQRAPCSGARSAYRGRSGSAPSPRRPGDSCSCRGPRPQSSRPGTSG